jgi:hypothetical protein
VSQLEVRERKFKVSDYLAGKTVSSGLTNVFFSRPHCSGLLILCGKGKSYEQPYASLPVVEGIREAGVVEELKLPTKKRLEVI